MMRKNLEDLTEKLAKKKKKIRYLKHSNMMSSMRI